MRTTLNLDDKLISFIMRCTGEKSKTKILNKALTEYLGKLNRESIKEAYGLLNFDLDVKKLRDLEKDEV